MFRGPRTWVWNGLTRWLTSEPHTGSEHLSDFERLRFEIRPTDVLLVEGRTRVAYIIKSITLSTWTHSALYIGRLSEIEDPETRALVEAHYDGPSNEPLVIEAELGEGAIVSPLRKYHRFHVRICRPAGLSHRDAQAMIRYAAEQLGLGYDIRQILDLARFMFPYSLLPRRWRSSLFQHNAGKPTHTVCSTMIASAFHSVHFPIMPLLVHDDAGNLKMFQRNLKLFTPRDFDYSPYFNIIKYPMLALDELAVYRNLPWDEDGAMCNDIRECLDLISHQSSGSRGSGVQSVNLLTDLTEGLAPT